MLELRQGKELANKYTNRLTLETGCEKQAPLKSMPVCDPQNEMVRTGLPQSLSQSINCTLVVGQHHCWFFCCLKSALPLLRGPLDCQVLFVSDLKLLFVGGSDLSKDMGAWLLLWS